MLSHPYLRSYWQLMATRGARGGRVGFIHGLAPKRLPMLWKIVLYSCTYNIQEAPSGLIGLKDCHRDKLKLGGKHGVCVCVGGR